MLPQFQKSSRNPQIWKHGNSPAVILVAINGSIGQSCNETALSLIHSRRHELKSASPKLGTYLAVNNVVLDSTGRKPVSTTRKLSRRPANLTAISKLQTRPAQHLSNSWRARYCTPHLHGSSKGCKKSTTHRFQLASASFNTDLSAPSSYVTPLPVRIEAGKQMWNAHLYGSNASSKGHRHHLYLYSQFVEQ